MRISNKTGVLLSVATALFFAGSVNCPAIAKAKPTYASKLMLGQLNYFNGNIDGAIKNFLQALELNPQSFDARLSLINIYIQHKEPEKAIEQCTEAIKLKPDNREVHLVLASLLRSKDKLSEAADEIAAAEESGANEAICAQTLALIRLQEGNIDEAYKQIGRALDEKPKSADSHLIKAILSFRKGLKDEAIDELDEAIDQRDKFAEAHSTKGDILAADKKWLDAIAEYAKALKDDPKSVQAEIGLANVYMQSAGADDKTQLDNAISHYSRARELSSDKVDKNIFYGLALAHEKKGEISEALSEFQNGAFVDTDVQSRGQIQMHIQGLKQDKLFNIGSIGDDPDQSAAPSFTKRGIYFDLNSPVFEESFANMIKIKHPEGADAAGSLQTE